MNTGCARARLWGPILIAGLLVGWGFGAAHLHAADWTAQASSSTATLRAVSGTAGDDVFAVGDDGTILRFDGTVWAPMSGAAVDLRGIWAKPDPDIGIKAFSVGLGGWIYRYDNNASGVWMAAPSPTGDPLRSIDGTGEGTVFAVGSNGVILRHDSTDPDSGWKAETNPDPNDTVLWDVWGCSDCAAAVAVGFSGVILRYDGLAWNEMVSGTSEILLGVWGGGESDVFAVGNNGTMIHNDGTGWSPMESPVSANLRSVWGRSATDVYAVGDDGVILHYDGDWAVEESGTTEILYGVWGTPDGVFAVGGNGTILYKGAQGPTTATINGTATAVIAGKTVPVSGAVVSVLGSETLSAETGEDGQYTLIGLREGTHTLQIEAPGMDPIFKDVQAVEGATQTADLEVNPPTWIDAVVDDQVTALNAEIDRLKTEIDAMYTQAQLDAAVSTALVPFDVGVQGKVGLEEAIHALEVAAGVK
mgnify:CR=1 FL=1